MQSNRFHHKPACVQSALILGAILIAITALVDAGSSRLRMPHSILLVLVGAILSPIPAMPQVSIDPELVLLLFLPPLIYSSGVGMSWRGFRYNLRPILLLAIGCVLFTASAVAMAGHWLLGMPWAVAFLLGAVVSPPDPVAPMAIAGRLNLPKRLLTVLEGEGLVNDATALILVSFAVAATISGSFSITAAAIDFVTILAGETMWGLAVGWIMLRLRSRIGNPQVEILLALLTPFIAFWPPHMLGGSGVLAALAAGLYTSWVGPRFIAPATRLQGYFVWGLLVHTLEALLFLLTGLEVQEIVSGLDRAGWERLALGGVIVSIVVIVVRFIWVFPATYVPRWLFPALRRSDPYPSWQSSFVIGFTGIRGVVSLVAALSIPVTIADAPFPDRELILFVSLCVIMVTLVGQGSLLPLLLPRLGLVEEGEKEAAIAKQHEVDARIAGVEAVLAELDKAEAEGAPPAAIATLRQRNANRRTDYRGTADDDIDGSPVVEDADLQAQLIEAERRKINQLYAEGSIGDDARRRIERELDLEDGRNSHARESARGDRLADPESESDSE